MAQRQMRVCVLLVLGLVGPLGAAERPALVEQQERQKQIQADTDRLVRRLQTMLRVLEYNRLDRIAEKALLDEVTRTLSGLSREQMTQLIAALEAAGKSTGVAQTRQLKEVEARHERIVLGLKAILARYDAVRSLEQAAGRLEKIARDQLGQYLQTSQILYEIDNIPALQSSSSRPELRIEHQAGEQSFVHRDLDNLLRQVSRLMPFLPQEEKERLQHVQAGLRDQKLLASLETAQLHLRTQGAPANRQTAWKRAVSIQWQASGAILDLARQLRPAPDRLTALRQARQRLEQALAEQEELQADTRRPAEPGPNRSKDPLDDPALQRARELSARQGSVAFLVRDARHVLQPLAEALAEKVEPAETAGRAAEMAVRERADADALRAQDRVVGALRGVLRELDGLLHAAEQAEADPLNRLQEKLTAVDQLLREEQDMRDKAKEAEQTKQSQRLPPLAPRQQELAQRTEALGQQPKKSRPEVAQSLEKAAEAMERAAGNLQDRKGAESVARQDEAMKSLEEARKSLAKQVEQIEQRRQEIGKLEEADRKLAEIVQEQKKVAEEAGQKEMPDADKLAERQGKLTPPTREVGKQLEQSAPEASRKVESGAKEMEEAKSHLARKETAAAADRAEKAAKKLQEARKELARNIEQKKGEEAAEEQQAQPREVDTKNAAQQIAKALEQTQKAAQESQKAADELNPPPKAQEAARDLARVQKEVAEQAPRVSRAPASKPAEKAAELLEKGELQKALEEQKKALEQLEQDEKKETDPSADQQKKEPGKPGEKKEDRPKHKKEPREEGTKKETNPPAQKTENDQQGDKQQDSAREKPKTVRPKEAQTARQLAQAQKKLMQATENLIEEAQRRPERSRQEDKPRPSLIQLQKEVAEQAEKMNAPAAEPPATKAAELLQKGEIPTAVELQRQALRQLLAAAREKGEVSQREDRTRPPLPLEAANTAELAEAQEAILKATEALAKSQQANRAATTALGQAQAQAPQAVQDQLQQASQQLAQAGQQLQQGQPTPANQAQENAREQLSQALQALGNALARGEENSQGQEPPPAQNQDAEEGDGEPQSQKSGQKPGQKPGRKPGSRPGKGTKPSPGQEKNEGRATGYRLAEGTMMKTSSQLRGSVGEGQFIHLPPRQRELIRQALDDKLPPEYAALIQQYYVNIARGKADSRPAPPRR